MHYFPAKHPYWWLLITIAIIGFPQWFGSVWGLFNTEAAIPTISKWLVENHMTLPQFSPYWITVPLGLAMFFWLMYELRLQRSESIIVDRGEPLLSILALIAKNHSQEIPATPKLIAAELGLDENIVLAYMWKYHNEQYMTFRTGGAKPTVETPFFLSEKAWKCITVAKA